MSEREPLGIGIVGLGKVSPAHVLGYRSLPGEARIVAVCDPDPAAREAIAATWDVPVLPRHRELLARADVDAVVLLLPHRLHHPVTLEAIEAGKHVTVEKPMATSEAECREMIEAARARGLTLSVSENSRFVASYMEAARRVVEGWTGAIRLVRGFVYGSNLRELEDPGAAWKREPDGFAAILDAGPHFFYLLRWMFGGVLSIQAVARYWARDHGPPGCDLEDGAVVTGELAGGGHFSVELALNVEIPWGERLEIYGEEGSLQCDQLADPPVTLFRSSDDLGRPFGAVPADPRGWRDASIHRGAADFVRAIRRGRTPAVTAEDAAYAVRLCDAAYRSLRSGGTRVAVESPHLA